MQGRLGRGRGGIRSANALLIGAVSLASMLTGALLVPTLAAARSDSAPSAARSHASPAPKRKFGRGTSTNWSGYAVNGTSASHVLGTWTQPAVNCSPGENSWSSPWVGIDGNASNTVEQIGTDGDCQNGAPVYYAWYEMYPKSLVTLSLVVHPRDSFTGEVTSSGGSFVLKLTDNTTHATFSTTQQSKRAKRSSVEWIMEGPYNGLLSNFGSVPFSAASATISNSTGNVGSFSNAQSITMVNSQGATRAVPVPSTLASGASSFGVNWQQG